jgi:hypothetical protein
MATGSRMPTVKNVGEPCAGVPHARFEVAAGGNQASRAITCRAAQAPLADPTNVHLIRNSLKYVPRREREQVARDLKPIYTALDADGAQAALEAFDEKCGQRFPVITQAWLNAWEHVTPFLAFPPEVRRVIYTQRDRGAQSPAAQGDQDQGPLPQRGRRPQADLPRARQRRPAMDPNPELDDRAARVQNPLRRPPARHCKLTITPSPRPE